MQQTLTTILSIEETEAFNIIKWKEMYKRMKSLDQASFSSCASLYLSTLSPQKNFLSMFCILSAKLEHDGSPALFTYLYELAKVFDRKLIDIIPKQDLKMFCDKISKFGDSQKNYKALVLILRTICLNLDESLTCIHPVLLKYCLLAKTFREALPVLSSLELGQFDNQTFHLVVQDFLLYYYYGGLVLTALKKYQDASIYFQACLNIPASETSLIQIEALKRLILVELLISGKQFKPAKFIAPNVQKVLKESARPYFHIAKAFESSSFSTLEECFLAEKSVFLNDQTLGLVKQCIKAFRSRQIRQLTQTFVALPLDDIARIVDSSGSTSGAEIETQLLKMIAKGEIHATISHKDDGIPVFFQDPQEEYDTMHTNVEFQQQLQKLHETRQHMISIDNELTLSKEYISKSMANSQHGPSPWEDEANI